MVKIQRSANPTLVTKFCFAAADPQTSNTGDSIFLGMPVYTQWGGDSYEYKRLDWVSEVEEGLCNWPIHTFIQNRIPIVVLGLISAVRPESGQIGRRGWLEEWEREGGGRKARCNQEGAEWLMVFSPKLPSAEKERERKKKKKNLTDPQTDQQERERERRFLDHTYVGSS